jgi:hypothetical protein
MKPKENSTNIINDRVFASGTGENLNVKASFVKELREYNFNLLNVSDVVNVYDAISMLNKKYNAKLNIDEFAFEEYIDFEALSKTVLTLDEFKVLISKLRKHIKRDDLSIRNLVIIEMAWMKTYPQEITEVLDKDVTIVDLPIGKIVHYKVEDRDCMDDTGMFYDDFCEYKEEVKNGEHRILKIQRGNINFAVARYDQSSPYFIKKANIGDYYGKSKILTRVEARVANLVLDFLERSGYDGRVDISGLTIQNYVKSGLLYDYYVNPEKAKVESSKMFLSYKKAHVKRVHERFCEQFAKYLYEAASEK